MKKNILIILFIGLNKILFAQDYMPEVIPPSPTAYELGKYGQIPVGMFTGSPNYNLPLYEYKTKNLSIPISLSYNSNGIKVDQVESNVGLGWSLNTGGVISRIVRDGADDMDQFFYPKQELSEVGMQSPLAIDFFYAAGNGDNDTEKDIFMFNFPGGSGKFVLDYNKKIVLIPHQNLKVEFYSNTIESGFIITTSNGVKYIFTEKEETINRVSGGSHTEPQDAITAWYLSKIIHPYGDEIYFEYVSENYHYVSSQSQTFKVLYPSVQYPCGNIMSLLPVLSQIYNNNTQIVGKRLTKISSNNPVNGTVDFEASYAHPDVAGFNLVSKIIIQDKNNAVIEKFDFNYLATAKKRVFLSKVQFKNPDKNYQFEYNDPEGLTSRLSFSQDHWGYYNGKNSNTCLVPKLNDEEPFKNLSTGANKDPNGIYAEKGLLKKIVYPTKGYNELVYEPNTYNGDITIPAHKASIYLVANTGGDDFGSGFDAVQTLNCAFDQVIEIFVNVSFNSNECESSWDVGKSRATLTILNLQNNRTESLLIQNAGGELVARDGNIFTPNGDHHCFARLTAGNYKITLHPTFECIKSSAGITFYDQQETVVQGKVETGGLRIKQVLSFDPLTNKENVLRYYYGSKDNPELSSGNPGQKAYYIENLNTRTGCDPLGTNDFVNYKILNSNSLSPLFNTGNNNIYYSYVTISYGDDNFLNGGEEHEYSIHRDYPGNLISGTNYIQSSPWTNFGWDNGLEKKISYFKKDESGDKIVLKEIFNNYVTDKRNYDEIKGYSVRKKYDIIVQVNPTYTCKEADRTKVYTQHYCAANHQHVWFLDPFGETKCIAPGHDWQTREIVHPCYGKPAGTVITRPWSIENLDIMEYKNISYWYYLDQTINKQFDQDGLNPIITTTNYFYDNAKHLQLTREEIVDPKGDTLLTKTYYPNDLNLTSLINQNRISEPVKKENYKNENKTSTWFVSYKDWGNNIITPETVNVSYGNNPLETYVRFLSYDEKGNVTEVMRENDYRISYVWGYNQTLPVAKFVNIEYSVIQNNSTLTGLINQLSNYTDLTDDLKKTTLKTLNNNIRNQLPSGVMVYTYTYDPLIGITSETNPNGQTVYYIYDSFGRLEKVLDHDYNIIKQYEYHYKSEL